MSWQHQGRMYTEQKGIHGVSVTLDSSLQMWHMRANTDNNPAAAIL